MVFSLKFWNTAIGKATVDIDKRKDHVDFTPLLLSTLDAQPVTGPEERRRVYDSARKALRNILSNETPSASEELERQTFALEKSINYVESILSKNVDSFKQPVSVSIEPELEKPVVDERRQFAMNAISGGAANIVKISIQLVMLPLMAHLLGPTEFGLYALALPTISLLSILADGGLGTSLARESEMSTKTWSTAFWTLLVSCCLMALLSISTSVVIAHFVQQPRLVGIVGFLSLSFILLAFSALPAARLVRRGNLVVHSVADLIATLVGAGTGVVLAFSGAGAWSLAAQFVVSGFVSCVIFNFAAFELPRFEFDLASLKSHIVVGGAIIGSRVSELGGRQLENLLCGRFFGTNFLGSYTFASQTSRFLCESAGNPVWGALYSYTLREKNEAAIKLYVTLLRLLAMLLFPLTALAAAIAPSVFSIVLGDRWDTAAAFMQLTVMSYAFNTLGSLCGAVLLANGRSSLVFWAFTTLSVGRVIAILFGMFSGFIGIAIGIDLVNMLFAAVMAIFINSHCRIDNRSILLTLTPIMIASVIAGIICSYISRTQAVDIFWTVTAILGGTAGFIAVILLLQSKRLYADFLAARRIAFPRWESRGYSVR